MLSHASYMLTAVAALLLTCHAQHECPGNTGLPETPGLSERDGLKGQTHLSQGFTGQFGSLVRPPRINHLPWEQGEKGEKGEKKDHHVKKADVHVMLCQGSTGPLLIVKCSKSEGSQLVEGDAAMICASTLLFSCLPGSLDTVLVNLKHRLSRLEGVLALNGKIRKVGDKIFASNGKKLDFASALGSCEEAGGTLATPKNEEENKAVLSVVKQYNQYAYLGIKEGETPGQFKFINNMPLNYTKWHKYEPNGKGTEKCVEMYTDGSWNDKKCNLYRLTICEF